MSETPSPGSSLATRHVYSEASPYDPSAVGGPVIEGSIVGAGEASHGALTVTGGAEHSTGLAPMAGAGTDLAVRPSEAAARVAGAVEYVPPPPETPRESFSAEEVAALRSLLGGRSRRVEMPEGYNPIDPRNGLRPYLSEGTETRDAGVVAADPYARPYGPDRRPRTMGGPKGIANVIENHDPLERTEYQLTSDPETHHLLVRPALALGRLALGIVKLPFKTLRFAAVTAPRWVGDTVAGAVDWDPGPRGRGNRVLTPEDVARINAEGGRKGYKILPPTKGDKRRGVPAYRGDARGHKVRHYGAVTANVNQ